MVGINVLIGWVVELVHFGLIGLGFVMGWLWILFLGGPLLYRLSFADGQIEKIFLLFLLFNGLGYLAVALWTKSLADRPFSRHIPLMAALLVLAGTLLIPNIRSNTGLMVAACACAGLGSAILICRFGQLFSLCNNDQIALYYSLAVLLGSFFYLPALFLPVDTALYISSGSPLLAWGCYYWQMSRPVNHPPTSLELPESGRRLPFSKMILALVLVYYLAGGLMYKIVTLIPSIQSQHMFWISNISYCVVCLIAGLIIYYRPELNANLLYRPVLALLGTAFLLLPFVHNYWIVVPFVLFQTAFALFDLYIWLIYAGIAARQNRPLQVFGWGFFAITLSMFIASFMYTLIMPRISVHTNDINFLAVLAALLMFAASFIFQNLYVVIPPMAAANEVIEPELPADMSPGGVPLDSGILQDQRSDNFRPDNHISMIIEELSSNYGLTKREREVLLLLAKGYNNPYMCIELNISVNTLKTHLRNIYQKTGVSNRQELLHMIHQ